MIDREFETQNAGFGVRLGRQLYPWRGVIGLPFLVACLVVCHPLRSSMNFTVFGSLVLVAGLGLRSWGVAAWYRPGERKQHDGLITNDGPYAYTRNPRYLGNLLMGLGGCTLAGLPHCYLAYGLLWSAVHVPVVMAEEAALRTHFGPQYEEYCRRVPRFIGLPSSAPPFLDQLVDVAWMRALQAEWETIAGWLCLAVALWCWRVTVIQLDFLEICEGCYAYEPF